jgi:hypothetical protein
LYIKLDIKEGYTTMHGQPIIKRTRGSIRGKGKQFSPLRNIQTGSGANTASFSVDTGDAFPPEIKTPAA